jgi:hypothetical protein
VPQEYKSASVHCYGLVDISIATCMLNNTVSTVAMIQLSKQHATVEREGGRLPHRAGFLGKLKNFIPSAY